MIASATSWKREPFKVGVTLPYSAVFGIEEATRLRAGLIPQAMEDKWFIYFEEPHLFFHRSWSGKPIYRLTLRANGSGVTVEEALWSSDLAAIPNADTAYQAKLLDFLVSNLLLGETKPFPRPGDIPEPSPGVFQHHVSGTGYSEMLPSESDKPIPPPPSNALKGKKA